MSRETAPSPQRYTRSAESVLEAATPRVLAWKVSVKRRPYDLLLLAALLVPISVFHLATLLRTPAPWVDEAYNANRAWGLLQTGHAFGTLDAGVMQKYDAYWHYFPWLGTAIHALFLQVFGLSYFSIRFSSLVFGIALLLVVYIIGRQLYSVSVGLLAVGLTAISVPFMSAAHMGRHDIIAAAFGFSALALYFTDDGRGFSGKSLLSGLLVGLALDIHMNVVIYGIAIGALYLFTLGRQILRSRRFWGFAAGVGVGLVYFAMVHLLPNPSSYFQIFSLGNGSSRTPPILVGGPAMWLNSFMDTVSMVGLLPFGLVLLSVVLLGYKTTRSYLQLVTLFAVLFFAVAIIIRVKSSQYAILVYPVASLLIAALLDRLLHESWRATPLQYIRTIAVGSLLIGTLVLGIRPAMSDANSDYQDTLSRVEHDIHIGDSVIGPQTYWFAIPHNPYYSWEQLVFYRRYASGSSLVDAFRFLHPDYFIRDEWVDAFVTDDPELLSTANDNTVLPRTELESFLTDHTKLIDSIDTDAFGKVRIYKIDWSSLGAASGQGGFP